MRACMGIITAAGLLLAAPLAAVPAGGSGVVVDGLDTTAGWLAWHGCWKPVGEEAPEATLVCVLPGDDATAVRMTTWVEGSLGQETVLRADGVARPVEEGGCLGNQSARWSADGRRVFVRSEFSCGGLGRTSTGVLAFVVENEWVDVQALTVADQHLARSIRYRAVPVADYPAAVAAELGTERRLVQETARLQYSMPLDVAAVVEASREIAPPAVEALLGARQHGFAMDANMLLRLQREGVPASVIDMMVALSYPQRFAVRERPQPTAQEGDRMRASRDDDTCYDPFLMRPVSGMSCSTMPRYNQYNRYGYGRDYGYSPWGYDPYGWRPGGSPVVVIVEPEREVGEVVKGRGYANPAGTSSTRGAARPRQEPAARGSDAGAARPATPSSSTGSTRTTEEGSSSGTSTGRTAVPRGGGGGNQQDESRQD
jgi:hypothetical protein